MNRRSFVFAVAAGAAVLASSRGAMAADHLAEAVSATEEAIAKATAGSLDEFVSEANSALKHAQAALARLRGAKDAKQSAELKKAVTHLIAATHQGKAKAADRATKHAEEALAHLRAAEPATPPDM